MRQTCCDTREDDQRDAVTQTALSNLLTQPHQEHRTGHQRNYRRQLEHRSRMQHQTSLRLQCHRNTKRLEQRQHQRAVTRVLRDLATPSFAFLLQLLQMRHSNRCQLHNDRSRDVRHDPQRKDGKTRQRTTREHVEHAQDAAFLRLKQIGQYRRINTRHRIYVHRYDKQPTHPAKTTGAAQVTVFAPLATALLTGYPYSAMLPPAASTAARAPLVNCKPCNLTARLISPANTTLAVKAVAGTTPACFNANRSTVSTGKVLQIRQTHLRSVVACQRNEATLRQATLQRHLTAFETNLVETAGTRFLTFVTATCSLTPDRNRYRDQRDAWHAWYLLQVLFD